MNKLLHYSAIAGIISIVLGIPLGIIDALITLGLIKSNIQVLHIITYSLLIIFYTLFIMGFVHIGQKLKNSKLIYSSYLLIAGSLLLSIVQIILSLSPKLQSFIYQSITLFIIGIISIIFGYSLLSLRTTFGSIAKATAILNILAGISLVTILLSFIGTALLIPIYIMEILILFRASKIF